MVKLLGLCSRFQLRKPPVHDTLEIVVESPPVTFHGTSNSSSGALLTGQLKLKVPESSACLKLTKLSMVLRITFNIGDANTTKGCRNCRCKIDTLQQWSFLSDPKIFTSNTQKYHFPWSCHLEGKLPSTTHCDLGSIEYDLVACAVLEDGEEITTTQPIEVSRVVSPKPNDIHRCIFPPTDIVGHFVVPPVIQLSSSYSLSMTLYNIIDRKESLVIRWRLKKLSWQIEEHCRMESASCTDHRSVDLSQAITPRTETTCLGSRQIKDGWKSDYDTHEGSVHLEFEIQIPTSPSQKSCSDIDAHSALTIKHHLNVEMIIVEEYMSTRRKAAFVSTGRARLLRTRFPIIVTGHTSTCISWDDEMPPNYENVSGGPPGYGIISQRLADDGWTVVL